jgi:hypothetical protein
MATPQRKIKPAQKRQLIEEAGGKCANPGCANWRVHIHHIKHWHIYKAHDSGEMIAVCPSCHDAVHHGTLPISDETLHIWKGMKRDGPPAVAHLYVEPAQQCRLRLGTFVVETTNEKATVFELSNRNQLQLRLLDQDILQVRSRLWNRKGIEVLRVAENHVRVARDEDIRFDFQAGHARVMVPATEKYVPPWLLAQMLREDPNFQTNGQILALDLEVIEPGLVQVQGCWQSDKSAVVITRQALHICHQGAARAVPIEGQGDATRFIYAGPISLAMFNLG